MKTTSMLRPSIRFAPVLLALILALLIIPLLGLLPTPMPASAQTTGPVAGAQLWLRADTGVTNSAGVVSSWADQSGFGNNATMGTAGRQPALVASAQNGLPVLRFSGAQSLVLNTPASPRTFTVFVVGKNSNPSESISMILGPSGSGPNNQLRWENGSQVLAYGTSNGLASTTSTIGNTRVFHSLVVRYDGTTLAFYRDGKLISSRTFSATGNWTLSQIGAYYSSSFLQGDLAEILIYPAALSDASRNSTTGYLHKKWGLADDVAIQGRLQDTTQPLLKFAQGAAFRNVVYNGIARRFDGDDNVLLSDVIRDAEQSGAVDPASADWQAFKAKVSSFQDVNGTTYKPQIYIPNYGEVAPDPAGVAVVVYETDLRKTALTAYQLDSSGTLRPKSTPVDEAYSETYEVWVLSVNEPYPPDAAPVAAQLRVGTTGDTTTAKGAGTATATNVACNPTGLRNNKGMEYLTSFKVPSPSSVEHWTAGKLEPRLIVVGKGGAEIKNANFGKIKRKTIRNGVTVNLFMTTWDRATWGDYWAYKWVEIDGGPKVEISLGLSFQITSKIGATGSVKAIFEKKYDDMGAAVVGFEESTSIRYGTGTIDWSVCSVGGDGNTGNENLALGAVAAASTTFPGYSPARVNDGSTNTTVGGSYSWANDDKWSNPAAALPQWVQLDLGSTKTFSKVVIYTSSGYPIQDYDVQYWNGSSWVTLVAKRGNTALSITHTFGATSARLVRILGLRGPSNQPQYVRINEFQVF